MIKKFLLDVDGVLTNGQFIYSSEGKNYKIFGAHDADGLKILKHKLDISFITADKKGFDISKRRIEDMGFEVYLCKEPDRKAYIDQNYDYDTLAYMGDGIYDAEIIRLAKLGISPKNARIEARESADYITPSNGGEGAVLDACLYINEFYFGDNH
jgi:3-deoxy-D-manno-octulosonate 8-phosphate phosphatase (KDO 8-P phosphatase)